MMVSSHKDQFGNDGIKPYPIHLETVVKTLKFLGVKDSDILCAGYLHNYIRRHKIYRRKNSRKFWR